MKSLTIFTITALWLSMGQVFAADSVAINVTGNIISAPCTISNESVSQTVDLGQDISKMALKTAGSASDWVSFAIKLVNCPAATDKVTMTLHGSADDDNPADMYKVTGDATNIAVQVQSQQGDKLGDGQSISGNITNSAYTYDLRARVFTQRGDVGPGEFESTVTATFVYQ